ncbi:MAG: hypothetical protein PHC51_13845 [bacterium]|nr:hypothetical protein [bacterium]
MIKAILLSIALSITQLGCATSTFSHGRDFPSEKVSSIVRGKTTTLELAALFGQPFSKTLVSDTDEKWLYLYVQSSAKAKSYIVSMKVESTVDQKMLDVLVRNGVVINFTFNEGGNPAMMSTQSP